MQRIPAMYAFPLLFETLKFAQICEFKTNRIIHSERTYLLTLHYKGKSLRQSEEICEIEFWRKNSQKRPGYLQVNGALR